MRKIFYAALFLLVLTACGRDAIPAPDLTEDATAAAIETTYTPVAIHYETPEIPQHNEYIVALEIDPASRTVHGISRINFTNRTAGPLEEIVLRVFLNAFGEGTHPRPYPTELIGRMHRSGYGRGYMEVSHASLNNDALDFTLDSTVVTLHLPAPLEVDTTVQLLLQFNAYVPKLGHYMGGNAYAMWFGMFLPVIAVYDENNGWNTDNFYPISTSFMLEAAHYHVSVTTPVRYQIVGTGTRVEEIIDHDTGIQITRFSANMVRDFAFAVLSPYYNRVSTSTTSGVEINLFHRTDGFVENVLNLVRGSMDYFEYRVGTYPFGQINIVETDMLVESVAFSQMVFADTMMLGSHNHNGLMHSIGSQWFTGVIGTNPVAWPWLGSSLTRFIGSGLRVFTPEHLHEYMQANHAAIAGRTDLFMYQSLDENTTIWGVYVPMQIKAMLMIYQLQQRMGDELFGEFIGQYYREFSFQIATVEDFINLAEEMYGESLMEFFNAWIYEGTVPPI